MTQHADGTTADSDDSAPPDVDVTIAHQARLYNYLTGGKDHFAADRAYGDALEAAYPGSFATARSNRAFLARAVRYLAAEAGIDQFLDIGTGIPAPGSTHEVAQDARPGSKITYVDNDPVVGAHARALFTCPEPGIIDYIDADLHDPQAILDRAAATLDFTRPVAVLLLFVLHVFSDDEDPGRIVTTLMDAMAPGSYLAISHGAADLMKPEEITRSAQTTREMSREQYVPRTRDQIARFFTGLDLVEPGLVRATEWRPAPGDTDYGQTAVWAGVARKTMD